MKKYIYTISICLLALCMAGCSEEELIGDDDNKVPQTVEEGSPVEMTFSVRIPEATSVDTRAFGEDLLNKENLWLVVFDDNGYLTQSAKATYNEEKGVVNGETFFTVELNMTTNPRIVHFIANHEIGSLSFGSEDQLIGGLITEGTNDAYWQRVEFPHGIYGEKQSDNTYIIDQDVVKLMHKVPLVRNFAKIMVKESTSNFVLEGFIVVNTPDRGSVAPYVGNKKFANYVKSPENVCVSYSELTAQPYTGFMPAGMVITNTEPGIPDMSPKYMYERRYTTTADSPTFIIVQGKYNGGASSFYKVELGQKDKDGQFVSYHILRNFEYAVDITYVGGAGYNSAAEAAGHLAFNNIYANTATQSLLNISNGKDRLFVNFTNKIIVDDKSPVELKYKYVTMGTEGAADIEKNSEVETGMVVAGNVIASATATGKDSEGWNTITLQPNPLPDFGSETQTVTLYIPGGLRREINLMLRNPWEMGTIYCPETVGAGEGAEVAVSFDIPDNLGNYEYMFPLEFKLESNRGNLYNNPANADAMVVWYGETSIPDKTGKSFGFTKLLTYEAYLALPSNGSGFKTIACSFLTNVAESGVTTTVYITNPYFYQENVTFTR